MNGVPTRPGHFYLPKLKVVKAVPPPAKSLTTAEIKKRLLARKKSTGRPA